MLHLVALVYPSFAETSVARPHQAPACFNRLIGMSGCLLPSRQLIGGRMHQPITM